MTHHEPTEREQSTQAPDMAPASVWRYLESSPGFIDGLRQAEADLTAGKGAAFKDDDEAIMAPLGPIKSRPNFGAGEPLP